jgi:transposase-like protein
MSHDAPIEREDNFRLLYQFFKRLRNRYGRKTIFTDGAQWYNNACRWLRLKHIVYEIKFKNLMERFIQHIKDRTECFDDHFPCRKREECDRKTCVELAKIICTLSEYGNEQAVIYYDSDDGGWLS